jgi:hypothetical protein
MRRIDLEHIIRASAEISDDDEIIVIGSQAILGSFPDAPRNRPTEADVYPRNRPERADLIDAVHRREISISETYGTTRRSTKHRDLPQGWRIVSSPSGTRTPGQDRVVPRTHGLVVSKTIAGREKDLLFLEGGRH